MGDKNATKTDDVTLVDHKWLEVHGHGSRPTIWRKRKSGEFPEPAIDGKWTLEQIREHLQNKQQVTAA